MDFVKRSNKFFLYILGITFSCFFMFFFTNNKLMAVDSDTVTFSFECIGGKAKIDNEIVEVDCEYTNDIVEHYFEYKLTAINVPGETSGDGITVLDIASISIPSSAGVTDKDTRVTEIITNVIKVSNPDKIQLQIGEIILPQTLRKIEDKAFNNILSLQTMRIPNEVEYIGKEIFHLDSNNETPRVENVYLNHYSVQQEDSHEEYLVVFPESFPKKDVTRVISTEYDKHEALINGFAIYESSGYVPDNYVTVISYDYYPSIEKYYKEEDASRYQYYVGLKSSQIYKDSASLVNAVPAASGFVNVPDGMNFDAWEIDYKGQKIKVGDSIAYQGGRAQYKVLPKFQLKDATFDALLINATDNEKRYDASRDLIELSLNVEKSPENQIHDLFGESGFTYSLTWFHQAGSASIQNVMEVNDLTQAYTSSYFAYKVSQTGKYHVTIDYSYTYSYACANGETCAEVYRGSQLIDYVSINILPAPLYIHVGNESKIYGEKDNIGEVEYTAIGLLDDETITNISYSLDNKVEYKNVGTYNRAVKAQVNTIRNTLHSEDATANYNIIYYEGDYIITPKPLDVNYALEDTILTYLYGQPIDISREFVVTGIDHAPNKEEKITITFIKDIGITVGEYGVQRIEGHAPNYKLNFDKTKEKLIIRIAPLSVNAALECDGLEFSDTCNFTYDGNAKNIKAYYDDINGKRIYLNTSFVKGGRDYTKVISPGIYEVFLENIEDVNYKLNLGQEKKGVFVDKATPVITTGSSTQNFTYTGKKIYPKVSINNNEQTPEFTCKYGNEEEEEDCVVARNGYQVTVEYKESANYKKASVVIIVNINKYIINLNPRRFTFNYGENINPKETIEINGEEVVAVYTTNAGANPDIGFYDIVNVLIKYPSNVNGTDHGNYQGSIVQADAKGTIEVVPRPIEIVYYNYSNLVYNGQERNIGAYAIDSLSGQVLADLELTHKCDEGVIKDAQIYHLRTYFDNPRYVTNKTNLLVFEIAKAQYDMSNIKFADKKFRLDFSNHAIFIEGELPEGVEVKYTIDGEEGNATSSAFKHTVVASFIIDSKNYLPVEDMSATLDIDMTWVFMTIALAIFLIAAAVVVLIQYIRYRRVHPKKIKLKIKNIIGNDLAAIRSTGNPEETMGAITRNIDAKTIKKVVEVEESATVELAIEDEDDIIEKNARLKSFIDRIYAANSELKYYYSEVKNELLSYEGITHSVDRKYEVFHHGSRQIAKLSICNRILRLYVNLDPEKYDKEQYNHRNMSQFECHSRTPLRINVDSADSLRHAKIFIRILRKKENLKAVTSFAKIDYEKFYTLKENIFPKIFKKMTVIGKSKKKKKK